MIVVPPALEDAVYAAARTAVGDAALAVSALARAVVDRSARYTSDRAHLARPGDRVADLAARAAFFTVADAMKIAVPMAELARADALPARRPLRIADLGAGCGAAMLGAIAVLRDIALEVDLIDRDHAALAIARAAITGYAQATATTVAISTRTADVATAPVPPADLIVMASVLNELAPDPALALVERALAAVGDDGAVIIIEPALRDTARALHAIRDAVLSRGRGHVFAPCTRRDAPCPALADARDWCHEDRAVRLPQRTAELARVTHLRDGGLKFAYLVLRRDARPLVPAGDAAWRVVSAPRVAKGKLELIGCSAHGRIPLRLLNRHRDAANRDFERADRGDVLAIAAEPGPDRVEVTAEARVVPLDLER